MPQPGPHFPKASLAYVVHEVHRTISSSYDAVKSRYFILYGCCYVAAKPSLRMLLLCTCAIRCNKSDSDIDLFPASLPVTF